MIVFGICCWISEPEQVNELKRCLDSVKDYRVIVVNGKWYDVEGDHPFSLPEARALMDKYPNVKRIDYAGHHEWEARNKYLEECEKDDMLIVIDTDEYVAGTLEGFEPDSASFTVNGFAHRHGGQTILNRGITHPSQTRHKDRHNEYWHNDNRLAFAGKPPKDFAIMEDRLFRSPKITQTMKKRGELRAFR